MKEPKYTCPKIDEMISYLEDIHSSSVRLLSLLQTESLSDEAKDAFSDFDYEIAQSFKESNWKGTPYIVNLMEDIRDANIELRAWGTHYQNMYEDLEDVGNELDVLKEEVASLENHVDHLESENFDLAKEVEELEEDRDSWKEFALSLQENVCG